MKEKGELGKVAENPTGPVDGSLRVMRGGGWFSGAGDCRSADRDCGAPVGRFGFIGFRLVYLPQSVAKTHEQYRAE